MAEELRRLVGPYEIFELADKETRDLKVVSWERGSMIIHPTYAGAPEEKEISVLRVHLTVETKPFPPHYYDVTSKTLQAQLLPLLMERGFERWTYRITAYGVAPGKRFTLERVPY